MRHIEQTHAIQDQDQESFDFYYNYRLAQMERLVSLGVSILDIRKSMLAAGVDQSDVREEEDERILMNGGGGGRLFHDISRGEVDSQAPYARVVRREHFVHRNEPGQPTLQEVASSTGTPAPSTAAATGPSPPAQSQYDKDKDNHTSNDHLEEKESRGGWYLKHVQELILGPIGINNHTHLLDTRQLTLSEAQYLLNAFPKLRKIRYRGRIFPLDYEARTFLEELWPRRIMVIHVSQGSAIM